MRRITDGAGGATADLETVSGGLPTLGRGAGTEEIVRAKEIVLEVMSRLMTKGVHYGTIPGVKKPSLWKPGAEMLATTFGLAVECEVIDCDESDGEIRYRARGIARYRGETIGADERVCSSLEKKYKWRKPVHPKEWDDAPPERRTEHYNSDGEKEKKVRQEPEDVRNTILGMASKRAYVSVILRVTGASDVFTQDLEDLPEGTVVDIDERKAARKRPERASEQPGAKAEAPKAAASAGPGVEVTEVRVLKEGKNKNGPWTLHKIVAGGQAFITFDTKHYALAKEAKEAGRRVVVDGKKNDKGDFDLVSIALIPTDPSPAEAPAPAPLATEAAAPPAAAPAQKSLIGDDAPAGPYTIAGFEKSESSDGKEKFFVIVAGGLRWWTDDDAIFSAAVDASRQKRQIHLKAGPKRQSGEFQIAGISVA